MMKLKLYLDNKTNEIKSERTNDCIEYLYSNTPDIVIEHYRLPDDLLLDYSYSLSVRKYLSKELVNTERRKLFESNGYRLEDATCISISIPEEMFLSYASELGEEFLNNVKSEIEIQNNNKSEG